MRPIELQKWRRRSLLSQARAAGVLKVAVGTIRNWEQGRRKIPESIGELCKQLDQRREGTGTKGE
jgi:DNA-binding transcriptional regulator YiaG